MAGVLWVILVLSVSTVFARIYFTCGAAASAGMRVRFEPRSATCDAGSGLLALVLLDSFETRDLAVRREWSS